MAMGQYIVDHEKDVALEQICKSTSTPASAALSENGSGSFECNICLDSVQDPVVTLCGHLYCWPCMYKWLQVKASSPDVGPQQPTCPVCKANVSPHSLIPLYCRGSSPSESKSKNASLDAVIPRRPLPSMLNAVNTDASTQSRQLGSNVYNPQSELLQNRQYLPDPYGGYAAMTSSNLGGTVMTGFFSPMIGMVSEMLLTRFSGASNTTLFAHPYTNPLTGSNSPRMRRQEMKVDKSLNRVTIFLLCCIILCLLLF